VYWFYVLERGAAGLLHLHVLVAGTAELSEGALRDTWECGRSDPSVYDSRRGATYYVTKWVGSDRLDFDLKLPPSEPNEW
jgi:hypothetical protein